MSSSKPFGTDPDQQKSPDEGTGGPSWDGPGSGNSSRSQGSRAANPPLGPNAPGSFGTAVPGASQSMDGHTGAATIPRSPRDGGQGPATVRIGLWGAPRSGKTTFLASLPIAAMQHARNERGNWVVSGVGNSAVDFLNGSVNQLTVERGFPGATVGVQGMTWSFQGEVPRQLGGIRQVGFELDIHDVSGESFRPEHPQHAAIVNQLADAEGLIYLFDPLLDGEPATQSVRFFHATLNALYSRVREQRGLLQGRLPHQVAVCVAKFDDPELFRPSVEAGWVTQDDVGARLPQVPEHLSAGYFAWLCDTFRGSTTRLVRDALNTNFHPDRISYHAISAIGFRLNEAGIFDYRSYANVELVDGQPRIATVPQPLNVLDPVIALERRISGDRAGAGGGRRRLWRR